MCKDEVHGDLPNVEAAKRAARTPPLPAPIVNRSKSYCPEPFALVPFPELSALNCRCRRNYVGSESLNAHQTPFTEIAIDTSQAKHGKTVHDRNGSV